MIYSNEFRMACLDCLSSHRHSSCIHINKVSDGQVYIINEFGGQCFSISKKTLRSTYPAQHALIRVKEYKQVFPNDDRCPFDPEFNVLVCPRRRCQNCSSIKNCITNVFVDSSSVVLELQERDTVDERALQKITAWRQSDMIDNEGKSVAENMPVSAHLMSIYHLRYLDFIDFFSKTNEDLIDLTDILRHNEEVYSGGETLEHRSLLFHSTDTQGQALWKAKDILRSCVEDSHSNSKPMPNHPDPLAHHQRSIENQQDDELFSLSAQDPTQIEMESNVQELLTEADSNYEDVLLEFDRTYVSEDDEIMYELLSLLGDHRDMSLNEIQDVSLEDCARDSRSDSFSSESDYFETLMAQREAIDVQERNFRRLFGVKELEIVPQDSEVFSFEISNHVQRIQREPNLLQSSITEEPIACVDTSSTHSRDMNQFSWDHFGLDLHIPENQSHISRDKRPIGELEFLGMDDYYKRLLSSRKPKRAKKSVQQSQDCLQKDEGTQSHVQFTNQDNSEYLTDEQEDPQDYEDDRSDFSSISCSRSASTNSSSAARLLLASAG